MQHKVRMTGISAALISAFFLGLAPVFGKAAMGPEKFSPLAVVAVRTSLAAFLLLAIMAIFNRKALYIYPAGLLGCALAGGINGAGSIFYYVGLSRLNASIAQMLYALYPFLVAFWLLLDHQPPSRLTIVRMFIAFGSAFFLVRQDGAANIDMLGVVFMLISAALYAFHIPINQRVLFDVPAPTVATYTLLAMSAVVIPVYLVLDRSLPASIAPWGPVLGLTAVTFISRVLLFTGVKHIGGMQTAILGLAELLVAVIFSHIALGESLTRIQWLGMAGLGFSLLLVWFEKPTTHPTQSRGLLSFLQPPDFPNDFYKH